MPIPWEGWLEFHAKVLGEVLCRQGVALYCVVSRDWISWSGYPDCTAFIQVESHPPFLHRAASLVRSSCRMVQSCLVLICLKRIQSSANRRVLDWTQSGKSFINNRNSSGPRTVPCGTLLMTGMLSEVAPSTKTCWVRSARKLQSSYRCFLLSHSGPASSSGVGVALYQMLWKNPKWWGHADASCQGLPVVLVLM